MGTKALSGLVGGEGWDASSGFLTDCRPSPPRPGRPRIRSPVHTHVTSVFDVCGKSIHFTSDGPAAAGNALALLIPRGRWDILPQCPQRRQLPRGSPAQASPAHTKASTSAVTGTSPLRAGMSVGAAEDLWVRMDTLQKDREDHGGLPLGWENGTSSEDQSRCPPLMRMHLPPT